MENQAEIKLEGTSSPRVDISRRKALKLMGGTVLALGGALVVREMGVGSEGLGTEHAVFIPRYERHNLGIKESEIPEGLDFWFKEGTFVNQDGLYTDVQYNLSPGEVLWFMKNAGSAPVSLFGEKREAIKVKSFQDGVLNRLGRNGSRIILGDVITNQNPNELANIQKVLTAEFAGGLGIATGEFLYAMKQRTKDRKKNEIPSKAEMTRRNFLKGAAVVGTAWATLPLASFYGISDGVSLDSISDKRLFVDRILTRLNGFQSNFHPEGLLTFFRNAVIADKMLTIAEKFHKEKGKKAKMGFNVGLAHSGIEDFLGAGAEFCRFVITHYPEGVLREVMRVNKDIETFCTSAIMELPRDFRESDIAILEEARTVDIKRELAVDENLARQLRQKLG